MTKKAEKMLRKLETRMESTLYIYINNIRDFEYCTKELRKLEYCFNEMCSEMFFYDLLSENDLREARYISNKLHEIYFDKMLKIKYNA